MKIKLYIFGVMLGAWAVATGLHAAEPSAADLEFFEKQVRPLLAEKCYQCHSTQAKRLEGGLYLDSKVGVLKGGESGAVVVPGKPAESAIIEALRYETFEMPPKGQLPEADIAIIEKWIKLGAPWPKEADPDWVNMQFDWQERKAKHWSWHEIQSQTPPQVKETSWPLSAIDNFILAPLEKNELTPAPAADASTLIRRLYLDLIGLLPTSQELNNWQSRLSQDATAGSVNQQALQSLVDSLLSSEHFGEKWGRHWLDLVRYAETYGHEFDYRIAHAHQYRDYVIRALNADVPYDQFLREHVAGDLIKEPRLHPQKKINESILGTGFWFFHEATHAPTDVRGDEALRIDNQIDVFSKAFLGLTLACARCHDHKFDAISSKDYYSLAGFLQSSRQDHAYIDADGTIADATKEIRKTHELIAVRRKIQLANKISSQIITAYLQAAQQVLESKGSTGVETIAKQTQLEATKLKAWVAQLEGDAIKRPEHPLHLWTLANLPDEKLKEEFVKRAAGNQHAEQVDEQLLSDFSDMVFKQPAYKEQPSGVDEQSWYATGEAFGQRTTTAGQWDTTSASPRWLEAGVAHSGNISNRLMGTLRSPTFTLTDPAVFIRMKGKKAKVRLIIDGYQMTEFNGLLFGGTLVKNFNKETWTWQQMRVHPRYVGHQAWLEIIDDNDGWVAVDEVRLQSASKELPANGISRRLLKDASINSSAELATTIGFAIEAAALQPQVGDASGLNQLVDAKLLDIPLIESTTDRGKDIPQPIRALTMAEGTGEEERVFIRGSHLNLGPVAQRRFLAAIAGEQQPSIHAGSGRLELAERMLADSNPFPARVIVNRLWHHLFGRGIVPTVDDFGAMGQPPSHPELLDWLASDLRQHGWSLKRSIRQMVLSRTYQMASTPSLDEAPRIAKIDPENILLRRMRIRRLTAEQLRDSILLTSGRLERNLYGKSVPVHLTKFMTGRGRPGAGPLDGKGRRTIYLSINRNFLSPMLTTFDFPVPFSTMGRRTVSNVPAQALVLMNDPFVVAEAKRWAQRTLQESKTVEQRISVIFVAGLSRNPTPTEIASSKRFLNAQQKQRKVTSDDVQLWADFCHMIFNTKEFLFLN